jgi:hypothetical protein
MALSYWTSFAEYTPGNIRSQGWTGRWSTSSATTDVTADVGADDGVAVLYSRSGTNRKLLSWDALDAEPADIELVARLRVTSSSNTTLCGLGCRGSGSSSSANGYHAHLSGSATNLRISRYVSGAAATLATANVSGVTLSEYCYMRLRCTTESGNVVLRAKLWTGSVDDEPGAWTIEYTDTDVDRITGAGWAGLFNFSGFMYTDWFGVATGGGTAPTSAGGGSPDRTGALSVDLDGATLSAIGIFPPTGSLSGTLGAVALSAAGTLPLTGSLSLSLGPLAASSTGKLAIAGSATITLAPVALASAGKLRIDGDISATLAPIALSASATLTGGPGGRVSAALGNLSLNSSGALSTEGSAGIHLSPLTAQATGKLLIYGELNASLGTLALSTDSGDIPIPSRFYGVDLGGQLPKDVLEAAITTGRPIEIRISDIVYNDPLSVTSGIEAILAYLKTKETRPIA